MKKRYTLIDPGHSWRFDTPGDTPGEID